MCTQSNCYTARDSFISRFPSKICYTFCIHSLRILTPWKHQTLRSWHPEKGLKKGGNLTPLDILRRILRVTRAGSYEQSKPLFERWWKSLVDRAPNRSLLCYSKSLLSKHQLIRIPIYLYTWVVFHPFFTPTNLVQTITDLTKSFQVYLPNIPRCLGGHCMSTGWAPTSHE